MIIQYPNHFVQKTLVIAEEVEQDDGAAGAAVEVEAYGSEYGSEEENSEEEYNSESEASYYDDEEGEDKFPQIASIPMIQDEQGHIYFIVSFDGQCVIKEINPADDVIHTAIYELQSEKCLAFSYSMGYFYVMDNQKKVNQLTREQESITLIDND
jgi:hypothetical protein